MIFFGGERLHDKKLFSGEIFFSKKFFFAYIKKKLSCEIFFCEKSFLVNTVFW